VIYPKLTDPVEILHISEVAARQAKQTLVDALDRLHFTQAQQPLPEA
jgi:hypothetical protein